MKHPPQMGGVLSSQKSPIPHVVPGGALSIKQPPEASFQISHKPGVTAQDLQLLDPSQKFPIPQSASIEHSTHKGGVLESHTFPGAHIVPGGAVSILHPPAALPHTSHIPGVVEHDLHVLDASQKFP